ncbi:hypothetical protein BASA61_008677, partial [Batrachochytrium salamandrivorans]
DIGAEAGAETSNNAEAVAGASASSDDSSPDQPSGSGGLSELDQTPDSIEEPRWPSQEHILQGDKESIQKAVTKVTEAFEGENKEEFVTEVEVLLTNALSLARRSLDSYSSKIMAPFYLIISKGATDQQSLTKKMHGIQKSAEDIVKEFLGIVEKDISHIIKKPQSVMKELRNILYWTTYMRNFIKFLNDSHYMVLFSKVRIPENEAYVEVTESYIHQMENDCSLFSELLNKIKGMIDGGSMRPRTISSKASSLMLNFKKRLGIKDEPSADTTTD